jgi:hypothetical protein
MKWGIADLMIKKREGTQIFMMVMIGHDFFD